LGVCDSADAAADFAVLDAALLASVLLAAVAAFALVCLLFRAIWSHLLAPTCQRHEEVI
jgi:hypothetical protein